jgi:hypothetical protein
VPESSSVPPVTSDYEAKTSYETARLARRKERAGLEPFGDPLSGVVLVAESAPEGAVNSRIVEALRRSLAAVGLERAYVTWARPNLLEEVLSLEPTILVAVGPAAARAIDSLDYPLAEAGFSEAPEGSWFAWTNGTFGLKLPALTPALSDDRAKRHFWKAFRALRALAPGGALDPGP